MGAVASGVIQEELVLPFWRNRCPQVKKLLVSIWQSSWIAVEMGFENHLRRRATPARCLQKRYTTCKNVASPLRKQLCDRDDSSDKLSQSDEGNFSFA